MNPTYLDCDCRQVKYFFLKSKTGDICNMSINNIDGCDVMIDVSLKTGGLFASF